MKCPILKNGWGRQRTRDEIRADLTRESAPQFQRSETEMKKILGAVGIGVVALSAAACSGTSPAAPSASASASTVQGEAKPGYSDAAKPGNQTIVDIVL